MFTGTAWFRGGRPDEPAVGSSIRTRRQTAAQSKSRPRVIRTVDDAWARGAAQQHNRRRQKTEADDAQRDA